MSRRTEYVCYFGEEVSHECMGADLDGDRNKREADKEIKEQMSNGRMGSGNCLLAVRKYTWVGSDGDWDLYDDDLYWIHPTLDDGGE